MGGPKGKYDAKLDVFDGWAVQTKKNFWGGEVQISSKNNATEGSQNKT